MKPLALFLLILPAIVNAQSVRTLARTNRAPETIDLGQKSVSFTDLQTNRHDIILLRANLDGIVYSLPASSASVRVMSYTNIAASDLEKWHIPTNRIEIATQRAAAKGRSDKAYKANVAAQRQAMEEQQAREMEEWRKNRPLRESQARKEMENKSEAERQAAIDAQREVVIRLERENARFWQKYADGPSSSVYVIGGPDDPDVVRSRRIASDNALRAARERLEDLQAGRTRN
jgi:hypothetical protein